MSSTPAEPKPARGPKWLRQIRDAYRVTRQTDTRIGWILLGWFAVVFAAFLVLGLLIHAPVFFGILGVMVGVTVVTYVFGRRAEAAAYSQVEGQPGAAAAVLQTLRGGWFVTPAVAVTKNQDIVHRVLGRPGVVLVAEAPMSRATGLLANERKRTARFVPDIPIHEVVVGDEVGAVSLRKLQRHVSRLPRALRPAEVTAVRRRLDALTSNPLPIPKGPMPRGGKMPRAPR